MGQRKRKKAKKNVSRIIGLGLCAVQFLASVVCLSAILIMNMLPVKYIGMIALVLLLFLLVGVSSQLLSKKKGIGGKIFIVLFSIVLFTASYYLFKTTDTIQEISGGNKKVTKMVVAVKESDPAQSLEDAVGYQFGVQYAMQGDDVRAAVENVNSVLGTQISTVEYGSIGEQAMALHNGQVQAIVYNDAYSGLLSEELGAEQENFRIIYTYDIESEIENKAAEVEVQKEPFTVYISGIDVYGAIETNSRSDVNILATVNPNTHQILLVTTPRDYYVEIPGISGGQLDKLTHAGIYGVDASMATLAQLYQTDIQFYARVNFTSLVEMIDALGGVDVVSEQTFTTSEDSGLVMNVYQGENHFNGQQALAFSRERQNVDGGDFQRGRNQQAVITAMIKKAISPAILTGANGILNSISGNVDMNMSIDQIQELIKSQLAEGGAWKIKSMSAEGTGDTQSCYSMPDSLLYVTQPNMDSVAAIQSAIAAVKQGQVFEDSEVAQ